MTIAGKLRAWLLVVLACLLANVPAAAQAEAQTLRAGAARVSITPPLAQLPARFTRQADGLYVRVLVVENGSTRLVMVIGDAPMFAPDIGAILRARLSERLAVAPENLLFGVTHTHNAPRLDRRPGGIMLPGSDAFVDLFERASLRAADEALAALVPVRMAVGAGEVRLSGSKNVWSSRLQRVIEGIDRTAPAEGPADRLGLVRFEDMSGRPVAFVLNYGINPVVALEAGDAISGDVPGAASRYLEERVEGAVALFTVAAAGNPLYRALPDPVYGAGDPLRLVEAYGTLIAEEAIATSRATPALLSSARLLARSDSLECPGKVTAPLNLPDRCDHGDRPDLPACTFHDEAAAPVTAQLGLMAFGPVALVHADANITLPLAARLAREAPLAQTWTASLNYGPMRYIVADADYPQRTYEATASAAAAGCAENGFMNAAQAMFEGL